MEDVYTVKVKTKPTRNVYPSERRYSATTVFGLSWVHVALAATTLLLGCLTLASPKTEYTGANSTNSTDKYVLVAASSLVTVFGSGAGLAGAVAATRWYEAHHISRFLAASIVAAFAAFAACSCACYSLATLPNQDVIVVKHTDVLTKNVSHLVISLDNAQSPNGITERVMAVNILIAAILELLWSLLSAQISYKGMKSDYKDNVRGNQVTVVTKIKGNDGKVTKRKEDFSGADSFLQNRLCSKQDSSDANFQHERTMNFLNKCNTESINDTSIKKNNSDMPSMQESQVSWGDTATVNQNTINFDKIFTFTSDACDDNAAIDA